MCGIIQNIINQLTEKVKSYKSNLYINEMIDAMSVRLPKMFEQIEQNTDLSDQLSNILIFIIIHFVEKNDTEKLSKMFGKCTFIGRKTMINLNQNEHKLISILKFFVWAITAIESQEIIKSITKQTLLLVYRTYTNPKLNKSEAKSISVEIIELLQSKLEKDGQNTEFLEIYSEVKTSIESAKSERKKKEKMLAVQHVEAFKKKRQKKHQRKKENDRQKNLMSKLARYN